MMTPKEEDRFLKALEQLKVKCSHCGHREVIPLRVSKVLCSWCGHYVYRDKQLEFEEKAKQAIAKRRALDGAKSTEKGSKSNSTNDMASKSGKKQHKDC